MAISDRIQAMYTHTSNIYDSVELTGVDTTDIDKNLVNVPNTLKEGYIDIINNGTDTLYNNFPKVSGEGTSLTLNNTYQAPMRNNLKGNTSQTGTPTPTSPIPVNVVSGDNTITISNQGGTDSNTYNIDLPVENLFDKNTTNILNGYISATGFNSYANNRTIYIPTIVGQTYTIQKTIGSGNLLYAFTENTPAIGTQTLLGRTDASSKIATVTAPTNGNYLSITIYRDADNSFTVDEVLGGLQIEKGSKANTYTPYGTTPIELCKIGNYQDYFAKSDGRNLFNGEIELGSIDNTTGYKANANTNLRSINYIEVSPNTTYTIQNNKNYYIYIYEYTDDKTFISYSGQQTSDYRGIRTFTTTTTTKYIMFRTTQGNVENDLTSLWQLEKGSTASPYQPYGVGKWYLHKEVGKVVLNGNTNENWTNGELSTNELLYRFRNTDILAEKGTPYICDKFLYITNASSLSQTQEGLYNNSSSARFYLFIDKTRVNGSSASDLKSWLSSNNLTVYYVLATPTSEGIPSNLINQLEEFYQAQSKNNQTNISQINNDLGFIISASALKKG